MRGVENMIGTAIANAEAINCRVWNDSNYPN
jgi:hypothetical protein